MGTHPSGGDFDPAFVELIRYKVIQYGFRRDDREDVAQQLSIHVITGMKRYDPSRSSRLTYADRIVTSKIKSILQSRRAQKRNGRRLLAVPADQMDIPDRRQRADALDDQLDVKQAVSELSAELRAIATLFENFTEAEVMEHTGLSRQKVRGLKAQLKQRLAHLKKGE